MPTLVTMPYSSFEKLQDPASSSVISCYFRPVSNRLFNGRNLLSVTEVFWSIFSSVSQEKTL